MYSIISKKATTFPRLTFDNSSSLRSAEPLPTTTTKAKVSITLPPPSYCRAWITQLKRASATYPFCFLAITVAISLSSHFLSEQPKKREEDKGKKVSIVWFHTCAWGWQTRTGTQVRVVRTKLNGRQSKREEKMPKSPRERKQFNRETYLTFDIWFNKLLLFST